MSRETLEEFRLGYVADPLPGDEEFLGRISIPFLTPGGVMQIRYRAVGDHEQKYHSYANAGTRLFNTKPLTLPIQTVYLCEGEIDTMTAVQCGLPAVGVPGTGGWKDSYPRAFAFRMVIVLMDGDTAGRKFGKEVAKTLRDVKLIEIEGDVNEFVKKHGPEALREKVGHEDD